MIPYNATILSNLLVTLTSTLAKAVSTVPLLGQRDMNNACTINSPFPTEESYCQAVAQYCENVVLKEEENLIFTYKLEDSRNNPLYWILRMQLTPANYGTNSFNVDRDTCLEKFNAFIDDSSCMQGNTKTVMGGSYNVQYGTDADSFWAVETRQRNGKPPCELSVEGCT
jgi:hypothetical protein